MFCVPSLNSLIPSFALAPRRRAHLFFPPSCLQSAAELALAAEKADLELQKSKLSQVQDFVQVSKIGRRLIEIDKLAKKEAAEREQRSQQPLVAYPLKHGHSVVILLVALLFWGTPLLQLPLGWFFPVGRLLCISGGEKGHLGVLPWSLLCSWLLDRVLRSAALSTGYLKPPPSTGGLLNQFSSFFSMGSGGGSPVTSPTSD